MASRPKITRGLWASVRSKTLKKKTRKFDSEDAPGLMPADVDVLRGRLRVVLAHIESNAEAQDISFLSQEGVSADAKEAAVVLVEALANDDTLFLVKSLQRYSCAALCSVVKMVLMYSPEPLVSSNICTLILNSCDKYAEYLGERDDEKVEEIGATLERFSRKNDLDIFEGLCQCLNRLRMPNAELAYIFAPIVMLPKLEMLADDTLPAEQLEANFELLANADGVIEAMEFMIENADVLFDSRSRKRALLKKGFSQKKARPEHDEFYDEAFPASCDDDLGLEHYPCAEPHNPDAPTNVNDAEEGTTRQERENADLGEEVGDHNANDDFGVCSATGQEHRDAALESANDSKAALSSSHAEMPAADLQLEPSPEVGLSPTASDASEASYKSETSGADFECCASVRSFRGDARRAPDPVCDALVLFDYEPVEDGEIALTRGDTVCVLEIEDDGWWFGRNQAGAEGIFPGVYVQAASEQRPASPSRGSAPDVLSAKVVSTRSASPRPGSARSQGSTGMAGSSSVLALQSKCVQYEGLLFYLKARMIERLGAHAEDDGTFLCLQGMLQALFDKLDEHSARA